jgi:hypothetical protein
MDSPPVSPDAAPAPRSPSAPASASAPCTGATRARRTSSAACAPKVRRRTWPRSSAPSPTTATRGTRSWAGSSASSRPTRTPTRCVWPARSRPTPGTWSGPSACGASALGWSDGPRPLARSGAGSHSSTSASYSSWSRRPGSGTPMQRRAPPAIPRGHRRRDLPPRRRLAARPGAYVGRADGSVDRRAESGVAAAARQAGYSNLRTGPAVDQCGLRTVEGRNRQRQR